MRNFFCVYICNHKLSFRNVFYQNDTEPSKQLWQIGQRTKCRNEIRKLSENAYLVIITLENLIYV